MIPWLIVLELEETSLVIGNLLDGERLGQKIRASWTTIIRKTKCFWPKLDMKWEDNKKEMEKLGQSSSPVHPTKSLWQWDWIPWSLCSGCPASSLAPAISIQGKNPERDPKQQLPSHQQKIHKRMDLLLKPWHWQNCCTAELDKYFINGKATREETFPSALLFSAYKIFLLFLCDSSSCLHSRKAFNICLEFVCMRYVFCKRNSV